MRKQCYIAAMLIWGVLLSVTSADTLSETFKHPPEKAKPWCYWYWTDGDISADGITKDLENMAEVGIKRAMIGNVNVRRFPTQNGDPAPVKILSPEWRELKMHALREAKRVGVDIYFFNCPGWSQSGGPWIKPEQSMRRVIWNEVESKGGAFKQNVRAKGVPSGGSQDIAVLAVPKHDVVTIKGETAGKKFIFSHSEPFAARSLSVNGALSGSLFAVKNGKRELVAKIDVKAGNAKTDFLTKESQTVSFSEVKANRFELDYQPARKPKRGAEPAPARVVLSSAPKVAQVLNKQMGRMHPTPLPNWHSYIFKDTVEPADSSELIQQKQILDLSDKVGTDGVLNCTLPKGEWRILYFGMITTGKRNAPAAPEASGLEVDKMSRKHAEHHFNAYIGSLLKQMTPEERAAFKGITSDSYEVGSQNWTDGFAAEFEKRNGYNPILLLPTFTGTVIDSAKTSDQFLWDLRRTVADMIAECYMGGLRDVANRHGLVVWCEPYGHWGFASDFTIYGGYADQVGGEFWSTGSLGDIECRATSSVAHTYGKRRTYAEAFTSRLNLQDNPYKVKARSERMFCDGINHFVLHVYAHQARDGMPGKNPWFGTAFHRNTPWFNESQSWVKYLQRCHTLLQWGDPANDVLVYIGDFAPQMTGPANPVPNGYQYDYVGSDAILRKLDVVDGKWVTYDENELSRISASWEVMTIPPTLKYIRPKIQNRINELEKKGGKIIRSVPVTAKQLNLPPAVSDESCSIRWIERKKGDQHLFFLSNFQKARAFTATLRVKGKQPELMNPVTGEIKKIARYEATANGTKIEIDVNDPADSFFVLFRETSVSPSVVKASAPATELDLFYNEKNELVAETANAGSYTLTMSDGSTRSVTLGDGAAAKPEKKSSELVITKALYGVPGVPKKQVDVTATIQALVSAGERTVKASNELAGRDPAYGTVKKLELVYTVGGKAHKVSISENEELDLSVGTPSEGKRLVELTDWKTESTEQEGFTETRVTEFSLLKTISTDQRVILDLGKVEIMAQVTLNGKTFDTLWMPPFVLDVTDALKAGKNRIAIRVTSTTEGKPKMNATVQLKTRLVRTGAIAQETATVKLEDTGEALINPGMGWTMHFYSNITRNYGSKLEPFDTLEDFPGVSTVYLRLPWAYLEPEEGKYNWAILDTPAQRWIAKGKKIALRLTCSESWMTYATPEWVKDAGAKGTYFDYGKGPSPDGTLWDPFFDDPVYLEKLETFIAALAKRYDGNPNVEFIDVGTYGIWGEGHTHGSSKQDNIEKQKIHIDLHKKYFKKTLLCISDDFAGHNKPGRRFPITDYALSKGVTIRDDSIMVQPGNLRWYHDEMAQAFWPKLPVILEHEHYGSSLKRGAWNPDLLVQSVEEYHASFMSIHWWPRIELEGNREAIDRINKRMGYRLMPLSVTWPKAVTIATSQDAFTEHLNAFPYGDLSKNFRVSWSWINKGVAPCYTGGYPALTIKDEKGGIVSLLVDDSLNLRDLEVGPIGEAPVKEQVSEFIVGLYAPTTKPGTYDLYISVGKRDGTPTIAMPLKDDDGQRRYKIGQITLNPKETE
jgi:hypothetical protein